MKDITDDLCAQLKNQNIGYKKVLHFNAIPEQDTKCKSNSIEPACCVILEIDGVRKFVLASPHYSLSQDQLKKVFNSKNVTIYSTSDNMVGIRDYCNELLVDRHLMQGNAKISIKSTLDNTYLQINTKDIIETVGVKILNLNLLPKYRAETQFVSPLSMRKEFENCKHPFFGVSLENSNFTRSKLLASLTWISKRFSKCTVLIGDSIHRITLKSTKGLSTQNALDTAMLLGKNFVQDEEYTFKIFESTCSFDFLFCSEVQQHSDYLIYHDHLKFLFENDKSFKESIRSFGEIYHIKNKAIVSSTEYEKLISSSCDYFLEEFAIFACLQKRGNHVMIYPGSFSTLSEIATGQHPNAPDELKNLSVVSLHIKKR